MSSRFKVQSSRFKVGSAEFRHYSLLVTRYVLLCALCASVVGGPAYAWPFADRVIEYSPGPGQWVGNPKFNNPAKALGAPQGGTVVDPCNESLVTLGDGGRLVLGFGHPVWDDSRNLHGLDFIVFGNPVWVGGDPEYRWQEPAFVEISMDENGNGLADDEWYLLLPNKLPSALVGSPAEDCDTGHSSTVLRNYAEYTPTLALPGGKTAEEFYAVPDRRSVVGDPSSLLIDEGSGGGDAFDIADAVKQTLPGVPAQPFVYAGLPCFHFVCITDALVGDSAGSLGEISAEIDAVSCVSTLTGTTPIGVAKKQPTGMVVALAGKVVSAVFAGEIFIQEEDRSSGLRVETSTPVQEGDRVAVMGTIMYSFAGKYLGNARVYVMRSGTPPRPLGTRAANVGGEGLSTTDLLVRAWGKVLSLGNGCFYLDDGSMSPGAQGLKVTCEASEMPAQGEFVRVTGISAFEPTPFAPIPLLRALREGGVVVVP